MATITASMVKELREKTGAGMMDCKQALQENGGDMEKAVDWLRAKGLSKAAKKSSRVAAEGLVGVATEGAKGALVEVNSETDFVARNEQFQQMVTAIASLALEAGGDIAALKGMEYPGAGKSVEEHVQEMVGTIGENMTVRRCAAVAVDEGVVASYMHNQAAPGLGKIGVLVALKSAGDAGKLEELGRKIAMHVAAAAPLALTAEEIDADIVAREKAIYEEEARESGKPDNIIEKMVEGKLRKFFKESALLSQVFVMDGERTIEQVLKDAEAEVGAPVELAGYVRMQLGEGIEKKEEDFAAEVAKAAGN
ncbi:MAG TPA: elongation factor Ts [Thermopetrobacter sp.]|nr:elongation factor Ts [Thermopetrobacter sp.]